MADYAVGDGCAQHALRGVEEGVGVAYKRWKLVRDGEWWLRLEWWHTWQSRNTSSWRRSSGVDLAANAWADWVTTNSCLMRCTYRARVIKVQGRQGAVGNVRGASLWMSGLIEQGLSNTNVRGCVIYH